MAPFIFILLFLPVSAGADSVRTVSSLTVQRGGSVTIPCHYDEGYKRHVKYWCKGSPWISCTIVVRTDSPQRKGGVSITDDPAQQVFTVTLSDLRVTDSDTYWCAVEKGGTLDDKTELFLSVTAGTPDLSVVKSKVNSVEGGSVRIHCHYGNSLQGTQKMWCRSGDWSSCRAESSGASMQIRDHKTIKLFSVTLRNLEKKDTGWYWCAAGDLQIPVHISVSTGTDSVRTVSSLTVQAGGSVTIPCHYDEGYEHHVKYWCKGPDWNYCIPIVRTDSPRSKGGVSITDDPAQQVFTVTLSDLQVTDSGQYWCAVLIESDWDVRVSLYLRVTAGTQDLSVEKNRVSSVEGSSVRVLCRYGNRLRGTQKMWCSFGDGVSCVTAGSSGASKSRVRLTDDETQGLLTVTVRELERSDTGWYWCAAGDLQIPVHIYVTEKTETTDGTTQPPVLSTVTQHTNSSTTDKEAGVGNTKSNHDILIPFLVTFGLLLLLVITAVVTWKLWNTHKNAKTKRKEENQSTIVTGREEDNGTYTNVVYWNRSSENPRFTEPDYETAYITVMPPADSGDEVTYSSIVLQHRETGQWAPPSCVDAANAVTYSSVAPQRKHSH